MADAVPEERVTFRTEQILPAMVGAIEIGSEADGQRLEQVDAVIAGDTQIGFQATRRLDPGSIRTGHIGNEISYFIE